MVTKHEGRESEAPALVKPRRTEEQRVLNQLIRTLPSGIHSDPPRERRDPPSREALRRGLAEARKAEAEAPDSS
jgi:hypothetical protein